MIADWVIDYMGADIKRMVTGRTFWIAVILAFLSIFLSLPWPDHWAALTTGSTYEIFSKSLTSETILFMLPLISVLPYGEGFIREYQTGAIKIIIHRSSKKEYIKGKLTSVAVSGCLVWGGACLAAFFILFLILFPFEVKGEWEIKAMNDLALKILRLCITGNICSVLSGIFGGIFLSGYMAYGMPFIIYYLLVILHERYLEWLYCIYPAEWLKLEHYWGEQGWGIWGFLLAVWIFLIVIYEMILERRLKEI